MSSRAPSLKRVWFWPILVAAVITYASNHSRVATPDFTHWIRNFDKIVHFSVYGLLATLILRASQYHHRWRWSPWITLAIVFVFGALDEWHQSFVPGRSCDLADWLADAGGATLAVLLYRFWGAYRRALEASLRPPLRAVDAAAKAP